MADVRFLLVEKPLMPEVLTLFLPLGFAVLALLLVLVIFELFGAAIQFMVEAFRNYF
jgi:hypothetical protein